MAALDLLVVGAGPTGIAIGAEARRAGLAVLVVDRGPLTAALQEFPTFMTFFTTRERLEIAGVPFTIPEEKPDRRQALAYYRRVAEHHRLPLALHEEVVAVEPAADGGFRVRTRGAAGERERAARAVALATGYFGQPRRLGVAGEDLPTVQARYREPFAHAFEHVVVVGGGNSAAEAALDLWRAGARVTLVHFGPTFDKRIKPWVLPDLQNRMKEGAVGARWDSRVTAIEPGAVTIDGVHGTERLPARFVYVMTGFAPNTALLAEAGVPIDGATGIPRHDADTLETSVPGLFIAGVVVAGFDANKVFIENGRFHGDRIVARLLGRPVPPPPRLSAELDT